jgi:hypothetical protein
VRDRDPATEGDGDPGPTVPGVDAGSGSTSGPGADDGDDEPALLLRERQTPEGLLVSVCDADCLGETYEDGAVSLEVTREFYGEGAEAVDPEAMIAGLRRATTANLVGERAVGVAVDAGLIDPDTVLDVGGTRHAQLLWLG